MRVAPFGSGSTQPLAKSEKWQTRKRLKRKHPIMNHLALPQNENTEILKMNAKTHTLRLLKFLSLV